MLIPVSVAQNDLLGHFFICVYTSCARAVHVHAHTRTNGRRVEPQMYVQGTDHFLSASDIDIGNKGACGTWAGQRTMWPPDHCYVQLLFLEHREHCVDARRSGMCQQDMQNQDIERSRAPHNCKTCNMSLLLGVCWHETRKSSVCVCVVACARVCITYAREWATDLADKLWTFQTEIMTAQRVRPCTKRGMKSAETRGQPCCTCARQLGAHDCMKVDAWYQVRNQDVVVSWGVPSPRRSHNTHHTTHLRKKLQINKKMGAPRSELDKVVCPARKIAPAPAQQTFLRFRSYCKKI